MIYNDITELAQEIDRLMNEYIDENGSETDSEQCKIEVTNQMMQKSEGIINPYLIQSMIRHHKKPFQERGVLHQI